MKKFFTLICALVATAATAFAAGIDDLPVCKHSYVLVADEVNNNGTEKIAKGVTYGDFFFTPTGHDKSNGKGKFDLAAKDEEGNYLYFGGKYAEYGEHLNSLRIKNAQDVLAIKVTAKSKVIVCFNGQGKTGSAARYPKFCTTADMADANALNEKPSDATGKVGTEYREFVAPDDMTLYIGSWNGDTYVSYIIVEANEAPGTPQVKVGPQKFDEAKGLWFRDITVKAVDITEEGSEESAPTIVTYTTDGTAATEESDVVEPGGITVYQNQTLKFQAFGDFMGDGKPDKDNIIEGADNEAIVSFTFDAPTLSSKDGVVTVTSPYEGKGAANVIKYDDQTINGNTATLTKSATVTAYSEITNGSYGKFTSKSANSDVLVLNKISEKKEIKVIEGTAVVDEEATAGATDGKTHYKVEGGKLNADPMDFFIKEPAFGVVKEAQYQIDDKECYLQMNGDITIYFDLAEDAAVTIVASKNSCKSISDDTVKDGKVFAVTVDGTAKQSADVTAESYEVSNGEQSIYVPGNVLKFDLTAGQHKFTRYTGTGQIFLSSILIEPGKSVFTDPTGIKDIETVAKNAKAVKKIENGQLVIVTPNGKVTVAGAKIK